MDDLKQLLKTIRCVSRNNPVTQLQLSEMCRVLYTDKYKLYLEKVNAVTRKSNSINENVKFAQALGQDHLLAGNQSTALGVGQKTTSFREMLMGAYATEKAGTYDSWVETDRLIGIGNGLDGDNRHDALNIYKSGYAQLNNALRLGAFSWGNNLPEAGALQYTAVDGFRAYKNSLWNKFAFLNSDVEDSKLTYFDSLTGNLKTSAITKTVLENHLSDVSTYAAKSVTTSAGQILSAFTSDAKGHVTGISLRSLVAADIPGLEISKITGLQTELDGKSSTTHNHSGIYQPLDSDLTAIAALSGVFGLLRKTAEGTWSIDTTSYVSGTPWVAAINTAIANLIASSPATLDTLNELAAALGNDPNFATTITNLIAAKASTLDLNNHAASSTAHPRDTRNQIAGNYEASLGNPSTSGMVLSSTNGGVRSWIPIDSIPNPATTAEVLAGSDVAKKYLAPKHLALLEAQCVGGDVDTDVEYVPVSIPSYIIAHRSLIINRSSRIYYN